LTDAAPSTAPRASIGAAPTIGRVAMLSLSDQRDPRRDPRLGGGSFRVRGVRGRGGRCVAGS
jgi:hypothetical protein